MPILLFIKYAQKFQIQILNDYKKIQKKNFKLIKLKQNKIKRTTKTITRKLMYLCTTYIK